MKPSGIRFVLIGSAIAMAIAGFGVFSYTVLNSEKSQSTAIASPSPDGAADAVSALGRLEPEGGVVKIASPSAFGTARVSKVLVKEGTQVQLNQPLAVMDEGDTLYASLVQAEAQVKEAQTKLAQVQAGAKPGDINAQRANVLRASAEIPKAESALLAANAEVRNAQSEYDRYRQLSKEGAVTASDLETRRLTLETKAQQQDQARQVLEQSGLALEQAKQELNSVAEVRPTDIQQAKAQVDVAVANFRKAKTELDKAIVRAPIEGQVLKVHADPGEVVGTAGIMELGKTRQMYAVAEVDENYIGKVQPGQRAKITSYAFPGEITGTVDKVGLQISKNEVLNTDPVDKTDTRIVEVKIRLDNSQQVAGLTNLQVKVAIEP
ncbi:MAG: ABC exporter membrane fusion protein [Leptolyngbyaceae cyanobacterium SU_3_3]|nr:ABC exporter membrane fusion protein [Leptolyngbyaceae cyanobacterium SU_3_3]